MSVFRLPSFRSSRSPASVFELMISVTSQLVKKKWLLRQLVVFMLLTCCATFGLCLDEDTEAAIAEAAKTSNELNHLVKQIIQQYKSKPKLVQKLQLAQNAWSDYNDAYLTSIFPSPDHFDSYGSIYTTCCIYRTVAGTNTRIAQLKEFLSTRKPSSSQSGYQQIDNNLNGTYKKVVKMYPHNFIDVLRKAELKWIKFRDADADAFSEIGSPDDKDGLRLQRMVELEKQRLKELKEWIDGTEEGDMCAGSIPIIRGFRQ